MKTFKHIIFTRFDTHSASQFDIDWLRYRIEVFKKYTLQSLLSQTNRNFALWIRYCPDFLETNEVKELNEYLKNISIRYILTSFAEGIDSKTEEMYDYVKDVDLVLETRIDSDDLFHCTAVEEIQSQTLKDEQVFLFSDGYIYQESTKKLWHYNNAIPFYTCVYPREIFINQEKKRKYYPFLPNVTGSIPCVQILSENKFIVLVHQKNDSRYTHEWVKQSGLQSGSFLKATEEITRVVPEIIKDFSITY